jgi:hypothetical protein
MMSFWSVLSLLRLMLLWCHPLFLCSKILAGDLPPLFQSRIHPIQFRLLRRRQFFFEFGHSSGQNLFDFSLV